MNTVPVPVADDRYILAIYTSTGHVMVILRNYDNCPLVVQGYDRALACCISGLIIDAAESPDGCLHYSELMGHSDYRDRLAKYKANLARQPDAV